MMEARVKLEAVDAAGAGRIFKACDGGDERSKGRSGMSIRARSSDAALVVVLDRGRRSHEPSILDGADDAVYRSEVASCGRSRTTSGHQSRNI